MTVLMNPKIAQEAANWIEDTAQRMDIPVHVYSDGVSQDGNWLSVSVAINQPGDAYKKAVLLQQIEDAWDAANHSNMNLLLVPARSQPFNEDAIARFNDLTARLQQILNRTEEEGVGTLDAERHQTIRQEWEETMREVDSLFPTLAKSA